MPTLQRAKVIQKRMGGEIYFDRKYNCYRVMKCGSMSLVRFYENYERVSQ